MRRFIVIRHTVPTSAASPHAIVAPSPNAWWRVVRVEVTVQCSADVATRALALGIWDAASRINVVGTRTGITAGLLRRFVWSTSPIQLQLVGPAGGGYAIEAQSLPADMWCAPDTQLRLESYNLQAADVFSDFVVVVEVDDEIKS